MRPFVHVVGARPNFMKIAPLHRELARRGVPQLLVHTGQHYDTKMSQIFFDDLGLPKPDCYLDVGSGSHAEQTAKVMLRFEPVCLEHKPRAVVVVGDVNSTIACALVASKLGIAVAHVEAGLRSFDRRMPEEINRVLTDRISDLLLTPSPDGDENLRKEGVDEGRIVRVGNVMIDSLLHHLERSKSRHVAEELGLVPGKFGVLTLHRPSNVDIPAVFARIVDAVTSIAERLPLVFPIHPRARKQAEALGIWDSLATHPGIRIVEPLGYVDFLALYSRAKLVLTDSGGLQEETTALGIPCLTLRENTERPITIDEGTNVLVGTERDAIVGAALATLDGRGKVGSVPALWDGKASERIADALLARF